jgi:hypothetical protein
VNLNLNKPAWLPFNFLSLSWRIDPRTRDISKELKGASVLFVWRREREIELKAFIATARFGVVHRAAPGN